MGASLNGILGVLQLGSFAFGESQADRRSREVETLLNRQASREQAQARERVDRLTRERVDVSARVAENRETLFPSRPR